MHLKRMCILLPFDKMLYIHISTKSIWFNVLFKASVSILIFCLDDLSVDVGGVLKSPTIIVLILLSSSPFCLLIFALCI